MYSALAQYTAVIGEGASAFADILARYFADVILLPPCPHLAPPVASHPDMLIARVGDGVVMPACYSETAPQATEAIEALCTLRLGTSVPQMPYPLDVPYNVLSHGGHIYCRTDAVDGTVAAVAAEKGIPLRHVRQGYAGCSTLSCGDFVLTADPSLYAALTADKAAVTVLESCGIRLPGYDCGFIGGASGFCGATAIFFGNPERHKSGGTIRCALWEHGVECLALSDEPLCDFGGIVCFPEKVNPALAI